MATKIHAEDLYTSDASTPGTDKYYENNKWKTVPGVGGVNQVTSLPSAGSGNYGNLYLLHTTGVRDSLWISALNASGVYNMASIALQLPFDPLTDVAGCCLWLAADALVGLSNGDPVTSWTDASTSGLVFTNGTATAPDYIASAHNGLPCVRNTGGGTKHLYSLGVPTGLVGSSGATTFYVVKHNGVTSTYYIPITVGSNGYSGNNGYIPGIHMPDVFDQHSGAGTNTYAGSAPSSSTIFQYSFVDNGSFIHSYINSASIGSGSIGGMITPASITVLFGSVPTETDGEIDICEILIYLGALSDTDRGKVETYLQVKWGY